MKKGGIFLLFISGFIIGSLLLLAVISWACDTFCKHLVNPEFKQAIVIVSEYTLVSCIYFRKKHALKLSGKGAEIKKASWIFAVISLLFLTLLFFVFRSYCRPHHATTSIIKAVESIIHDEIDPDGLNTEWTTIKSDSGHFSVDFPSRPNRKVENFETKTKDGVLIRSIRLNTADQFDTNQGYCINYFKISWPWGTDSLFSICLNAAIETYQAQLKSETRVKSTRFPYLDALLYLNKENKKLKMRNIYCNGTMYQLFVVSDVDGEDSNKAILHFFNSFNPY